MSVPTLNVSNLITIEDISLNEKTNMASTCLTCLTNLTEQIYGALTDITFVCDPSMNGIQIVKNIYDANGGLLDSPYISCTYAWTTGADTTIIANIQRIFKLLSYSLKQYKIRCFYNYDAQNTNISLTVFYPSITDKYIISGA
jgi:hypothetical protein